jgi:hypothetical protein
MAGKKIAADRSAGAACPACGAACPACGAAGCRPVLKYRNLAAFLFPMPEKEARAVLRKDLVLHACPECGHLFQSGADRALLRRIYEEYYANYPYDASESLAAAYREPFHAMFRLVAATQPRPAGARLLEIGCSKPSNLQPFVDHGFSCLGIDPSPLAEGAPPPGIEIISGFYESVSLPGKVSVIVSRFSLEHIPDVQAHVAKMRGDLDEGGLVFVQVPNMAYYFRNGQPLFVAHEHIQYFSLRSLGALFRRFGLSPVAFYEEGQPSILACFKKGGAPVTVDAANLFHELPRFKAALPAMRKKIKAALASEARVALYGCGLLMIWLLAEMEPADLGKIVVVDDNQALWGKFVPAYGVEVRPPTPEVFRDSPRIILSLNPLYHDKVIRKLEAWNVRSSVLAIEKNGVREFALGQG